MANALITRKGEKKLEAPSSYSTFGYHYGTSNYSSVIKSNRKDGAKIAYCISCNNTGNQAVELQGSNDGASWNNIKTVSANSGDCGIIDTTYTYFRLHLVAWYSGSVSGGIITIVG